MTKLTLVHTIECDLDAFWSSFFDRDLTARLFIEGLGFRDYKTTEQIETDDAITRKIKADPKLSMPGPVAKLLGSSFHYVEEGRFDKATKTWRWKMIPSALTDKLHVNGVLTATALGDSRVKREIEITIEANVMMVGGLIEDTFKKQISDGWTKGAEVQNQWLRDAAAK